MYRLDLEMCAFLTEKYDNIRLNTIATDERKFTSYPSSLNNYRRFIAATLP